MHSLKLVVGNGTVITYDAAHPHLNEARMNFGLMGVIVEITFTLSSKKVSPDAPIVQDDNTFPTLREVFGRPDAGTYIKARPALHAPGGYSACHGSHVSHGLLPSARMGSSSDNCQALLEVSLQAQTLQVEQQQWCNTCNMTLGLGLRRPL